MPKYEVWYACNNASDDDEYGVPDLDRFYHLASFDTYQEAEERVRDEHDIQYQLLSSGDYDHLGQPLFIDYYKILDDNGKEIDDA